jgi:hypothetical protein
MNPRVSRSSALASKATGFPIAKVAARLAVGYTLDELMNDITGATPAAFEPTIDYVVTKIPRFAFEKYPGAEPYLTTSMKSVGEVMAIGRTFAESLQKALRGLETGLTGLDEIEIPGADDAGTGRSAVTRALGQPTPDRLLVIAQAFRHGLSVEEINAACSYEPWILRQIEILVAEEAKLRLHGLPSDPHALRRIKALGFSDARLARLTAQTEAQVRAYRQGARCSSASTPAPGSSGPRRPICTRPTRPGPWARPRRARASLRTARRRSSWAAVRTGSARASNSTIAAATRPSPSTRSASSRSWSIAIPRPSPPTTTPPTGSISSR